MTISAGISHGGPGDGGGRLRGTGLRTKGAAGRDAGRGDAGYCAGYCAGHCTGHCTGLYTGYCAGMCGCGGMAGMGGILQNGRGGSGRRYEKLTRWCKEERGGEYQCQDCSDSTQVRIVAVTARDGGLG